VPRTNRAEEVDPDDEESVMRAIAGAGHKGVAKSAGTLESVGVVSTLEALLAGIGEALPRPAVMFIEGTAIAPAAREHLDQRAIEPERDDLWGTLWPRSEGFDIPATDENVRDLLALAKVHPAEEICDHVTVYRGGTVLLVAHDVGSDVLLNRALPPDVIERFRRAANAA
jgi:hypothetical protein